MNATGAPVTTRPGCDHVEKAAQPGTKAAPSTVVPHQAGAQAAAPGSLAGAPESRMAPASRSRRLAVCRLKSATASPCVFDGAQAKPKRSTPEGAPSERAAYTRPETKSCIEARGAAVQP